MDSSDTQWQRDKYKYNIKFNKEDKESTTRFRDMNTLKYVLRSIEKNSPWFNKIYLITTGHIPDWLDISHPKIHLVTHKELFIDPLCLPVFNSSAIEMNLVNLKDLSETFVYLNDDMVILRKLDKNRFFKDNKPVDFFEHGWIPRGKLFGLIRGLDTWIHSLNNNLRLINKKFSPALMQNSQRYHHSYSLKDKISNFLSANFYQKIFWIKHWHHPQPYCMHTLNEVYHTYSKEIRACSQNKFRSNSDLTVYLYRYWHLIKGDFIPYDYQDGFVAKITSFSYLQKTLKELKENKKINFVCFNDQMNNISDKEFEQTKFLLTIYLEREFPEKASFER